MALALDGKFYDLHEIFELALLKQLAVPGWTVEFSLQKGNTTRQRGSGVRIFRPPTNEMEIRWRPVVEENE